MKSRERVLKAFEHSAVTGRPPIDFSGHRSSGISAIAYSKLRKYLGLENRTIRVYDPVQQLAIVDEDILDLFGSDTIELGRGFALTDDYWADWVLPDGTGCQMPVWAIPERKKDEWVIRSKSGRIIARMPDDAIYFEQAYYPFEDTEDSGDARKISAALGESMWTAIGSPGPPMAGPERKKLAARGAERLRKKTDRAIVGLFGGNLFEIGQFLYRNDRFFMLLAGEPEKAHSFLDGLLEIHLENLEFYLDSVGRYIDIILFGDDLGMQSGSLISPEMYREFFKPRHKLMWQLVKKKTDLKIQLHTCGSIRELLPDLIDAGLDAINPVQITCSGMNAKELKKEFGRDLVFWGGGCDTRDVLPNGSIEEIRSHVKEQIQILNEGGGFVFQQVHNILANVPPENIKAMFDAVIAA